MATIKDHDFIPDLWSEALVDEYKNIITFNWPKKRSYGERLLRAAARGEDTSKIKPDSYHDKYHDIKLYATSIDSTGLTILQLYDYVQEELRNDDATDAMAYSMAATTDNEFTFAGDETEKE